MAVTRHEAIIAALVALCTGNVVAQVMREEALPQEIPDQGLANLRAAQAEREGQHLGTGTIEWVRRVEVEIVVQAPASAARIAALEAVVLAFGAALSGQTLGGLVDHIDLGVPEDADDIGFEGTATVKAAVLPFDLFYTTTSNPLEAST